jgi:transposase
MRPFSVDLRERVVAARLKGQSIAQVAEQFGVSPRSVRRYTQLSQQGQLAPKSIPGKPPRLKPEQEEAFVTMVREHPNFTLEQYGREWEQRSGVHLPKSTLHVHLQRLGGRFKKRPALPESAVK